MKIMTVLNVVETDGNVWTYLILLFLGITLILIGISLEVSAYSETIGVGCAAVGISVGAILVVISIVLLAARTPHKEYKVIIDEKTTFHEIYDKYDVIKQEGYIYTLVDKEK